MNYDGKELMELLQSRGVPAGVVHDAQGTHEDPQLSHRKHFWRLKHPVIEEHAYDSHAFRFSRTPAQPRMPAPCIGEHNDYVYTKVLGFSDEEFAMLMGDGVIN